MSAKRLRAAASKLREAGRAATPGPWEEYAWTVAPDGPVRNGISPERDPDYEICELPRTPQGSMDSYYFATMQPSVALALADWLDDIEVLWSSSESMTDEDGDPLKFGESIDSHALKICDAILGATS